MIPFNKPPHTGNEDRYVLQAMDSEKISGDGPFGSKCEDWFQSRLPCPRALLTPSCTHALELVALLLNLKPGDEVIMPSYTFVSTANAFVLRGAVPVFVDIDPSTMCIDPAAINSAITAKTKAIVVVHYAGGACDMDRVMAIAQRQGLAVVEDAAQAFGSAYKGKALGTFGDFGTLSFHETKNLTSAGEGGLLIINNDDFIDRAEIIREKGTNRTRFSRGMIDKYTWVDVGSSYLLSDLQAAYLWGQLELADEINGRRMESWNRYRKLLQPLEDRGLVNLPRFTDGSSHNAHCFYLKVRDADLRDELIACLKKAGILSVFHYIPLHSSEAGLKFSRFDGADAYTTRESERLLRLPMYYSLTSDQIEFIASEILEFYADRV